MSTLISLLTSVATQGKSLMTGLQSLLSMVGEPQVQKSTREEKQTPVPSIVTDPVRYSEVNRPQVLPEEEITATIRSAARRVGVNPETAVKFAYVESQYDPRAVSPTGAVGLFQLTSIAIAEVKNRYPGLYYEPPGGDKFDVVWNATIGALFIKACCVYLRLNPLSELDLADLTRLYAAFNVGIGTLWKIESNQIDHAVTKAVASQSKALSGGGPGEYLARVEALFNSIA